MSAHLPELLTRAAAEHPDRVALVEADGRRVTWAELDREVDRVARGLNRRGLVAGYRVMLALGNRVEFVTSYLGCLRARLVAVPVNPRSATGELARMVADSQTRLVIADAKALTTVRQAAAGLADALVGADEELLRSAPVPQIAVVGAPALPGETPYAQLLDDPDAPAPGFPEGGDPEALAVLLYTSGTSGRPRAAMLSHRALLANIEQVAAVEPPMFTGDDVVLGLLPLFHVYGLNAVLGGVLHRGARLVLVDGFDPEGSLALVEREAVSVLPVAPSVLTAWTGVPGLREHLRGVRLVLSGSAPLAPEQADAFTAAGGLEVHQGYGLTEAAPVVTSTLCSARNRRGSVGAALPGIELQLFDDAGLVPGGEDPGEIRLRGQNLFSGYWPDGADAPDPQGWFATGDVGYLDGDGNLVLVDRLKELVMVSGFNVYPVEVEEVVVEVAGVAEAAVIGRPDPQTGEAVLAYVRPTPGWSGSDEQLEQAVREHCATRLARFKQPVEVHVVVELPHTVTGKVAKGRLRAARRHRGLGLQG
ncbi:class I adenylate-forming enzyme family protein [Nocardioides mesophilus]|uniref:AMP-binding protein n=1 Tax=Nocardioides mesophilus TaxID=433659 RepID=A0A7G9R6M8_9ACTN|nr:AMP-binding protein [Nocardioides mesophilus]QNN51253.1 AMP-binding protein [Nocardioides mesophilus]